MKGQCACGETRFHLTAKPMFVHGCHCRQCQRLSGGALAINALIETSEVALDAGAPELVEVETPSGAGQKIARCPTCRVAVWSHYGRAGKAVAFVRVGALEDPDAFPPDIHIFTASKQPWLQLPADASAVPAYYDMAERWPAESLSRFKAALKP